MIEIIVKRLKRSDRERIERGALWRARDQGVLPEYLDRREADDRLSSDLGMAIDPEREAALLKVQSLTDRR